MRLRFIATNLAAAVAFALLAHPALQAAHGSEARQSRVPAGDASLYAREIGRGPAVIVLHGGPDFDSGYLLPDLDRLKDSYRRGKTAS